MGANPGAEATLARTPAPRGEPSERGLKLKERLLSTAAEIDIERARYYTNTWKGMAEDRPCMRAARALQETLRHMAIWLEDDELLAGVRTAKRLSPILPVERHPQNLDAGAILGTRNLARARDALSEQERRELESDILPYWSNRTAQDLKHRLWVQEGLYEQEHRSLVPIDLGLIVLDTQGHVIPGYRRVLELGFEGIAGRAARQLETLREADDDFERRRDFLESVQLTSQAVCDYSNRCAALAEEAAAKAQSVRKGELLGIAARCRRVPARPAQSFMEALQSLWTTHVALLISYGYGDVFSTGRVDQYLHRYYAADLEAGIITPQKAAEAVEELHLKLGIHVQSANNTITLGGLDRAGEDATNELSHMFLDATEKLGAIRNNISVRVSPATPDDFLRRAWRTHRLGAGVAFFNDEIIVRDLLEDGYSIEDARDYSIVGCVEPTSTGRDFSYTAGNAIMLVRVLEFALNEGRTLADESRRVAAPTRPARTFKSFEDLKQAFAAQLSFCIDKCVQAAELKDRVYAEHFPAPLLSSTIDGCIESGRDATRGGAHYNNGHMGMQGLATVTDSLLAIRWAVFERKLLGMDELLGHLRSNFEGAENLRQRLARRPPKYGNDERRADEIAEWIVESFCREVRRHRCGRGGVYRPLILSSGFQVYEGLVSGASADGRRSGEPVSDGLSPGHGTARNGLTAVLQSAARAGKALVSDGTTLTLNLSPMLLVSEESIDQLVALIRGYFAIGGRHVQFTPISTETLRDAQEHPERYPELSVKVSGYSAVFVDLPRSLQDDIIARTEFVDI